ncbi:conserved Plasmodium protein, unknown function [Plasmodium ovale wallikeri]|uniref:Origin recognition complex subunit 1 n=2 Tax=Plasmodium ovale TaxID=36330 RepID=A0A1A8ZBG7_PLAOA|nr:conserved Plasmodium protein, unknown function [Plasmodium ovale wallikeri]SBT58473.1 conserved Plasmodium protein, unknown function [Plasmodium ovale wallikeri]SBT78089.1 conserved Plasmodium protein, unknown function [Plasmodium ovale]
MNGMLDSLSLEDIANVKIKAYKNITTYDDKERKEGKWKEEERENSYDVYILTYIKHIVRIKANLALHGGLYSNYFEKYEEESISNIMLGNLVNKYDIITGDKVGKSIGDDVRRMGGDSRRDDTKGESTGKESNKGKTEEGKHDLNYSIKELLKKLIKSYKIRENKIFLVTGMLGCGKTTCVSLAIEYFNKFLQIEKSMNGEGGDGCIGGRSNGSGESGRNGESGGGTRKNVLFLAPGHGEGKKMYKKTPYSVRNYQKEEFPSSESTPTNAKKKLKISCDEPLFNFSPKKYNAKTKKTKDVGKQTNVAMIDELDEMSESENGLVRNVEEINNNIKNIFENNDLSPLRKNANIRNKIQFEQFFQENKENEWDKNSDDDIIPKFNEKYQKIVEEIKKEEKEKRCIYIIRVSAYLYRDDLQCIKSILTQLHNYVNADEKMENNLLLNDYIIKLENILVEVNKEKKQTLLIIENVEKFCLQNKQNLLYTLFDLLHKKNICINIICLTNVLDITQTLEKRIKSRFTFEMLHISPTLNIEEITKLVYKILYVNLDDFHLIKKYYSVYFSYTDLVKIQKFLQIYNSTMQKEIADKQLLKQWSYDINYGLDIRHIYHTCVDAILSICEYKHILKSGDGSFENNTILDSLSDGEDAERGNRGANLGGDRGRGYSNDRGEDNLNNSPHLLNCTGTDKPGNFSEKRNNMGYLSERVGKLDCTPIKRNFQNDKNMDNRDGEEGTFHFDINIDMSPRKLKENIKLKSKVESQYILNNVQSKFIRRHYIKKVLRDLCSIEYMILCAFTRLYKKEILPKTLYVIILEINKFKQAYPQEQIIGFSLDAYRRSFFRLVDLDIIVLSSYSLSHLNIKNFSNDLFGLHEPTKFPCYDIFLENIESYNLNHNLIQWVKHNTEVMQ